MNAVWWSALILGGLAALAGVYFHWTPFRGHPGRETAALVGLLAVLALINFVQGQQWWALAFGVLTAVLLIARRRTI